MAFYVYCMTNKAVPLRFNTLAQEIILLKFVLELYLFIEIHDVKVNILTTVLAEAYTEGPMSITYLTQHAWLLLLQVNVTV